MGDLTRAEAKRNPRMVALSHARGAGPECHREWKPSERPLQEWFSCLALQYFKQLCTCTDSKNKFHYRARILSP